MAGTPSPYQVLGVARDADDATIKKAYRRLAHQSHPDKNPGDAAAEARFKEVSQAYAVLSNLEQRRNYDEFGDAALHPNFDAARARQASQGFGGARFGGGGGHPFADAGGGIGDLGSLFENLFSGGQRAPRDRRGTDLEATIDVGFVDAALGCQRRITLRRPRADGSIEPETLNVRIPTGVADGTKIRLAGKGAPGLGAAPAGNLIATIRVSSHRLFRREDRDIHLEAPIGLSEAVLGTEFEIPTLDGRVTLRVPAGTDSGSKLRLRGKGIPAVNGSPAGDLYVSIRIRVPKNLDEQTLRRFEELARHDPENVREQLGTQADEPR